MLNSAASTLVSNDTSEMANGKKDSPTVQTLKLEYGTPTEEAENLNSQFASLKIRDEKRMLRPQSDQMTAVTAPELKETKHSAETGNDLSKAINRERNKRSLPSTPRSLYGAPSSPTEKIPGSQNTRRLSTSSTISNSVNNTGFVPSTRSFIQDASKSSQFKQTHIAVYKFIARHDDETSLDNGDPVRVTKRCEDLWFEGINMRTGRSGIFPSRYVSDILQEDVRDEAANGLQESQFSVSFLGSVEVFGFKGNDILCDAIKQIVKQHQLSSAPKPPACVLDVSSKGIKIIEHLQTPERRGSMSSKRSSKRKIGKLFDKDSKAPVKQSHFFALKNVTFCGCHPNNARFFAFITKHPEDQRFACHVFMSEFSTEPVANAVGRAFNEFYAEFLDYQAPVEDFYIE